MYCLILLIYAYENEELCAQRNGENYLKIKNETRVKAYCFFFLNQIADL